MKPNPKALVLVAVASGMIASAYLIGPAPAATTAPAGAAVARLAPPAPTAAPSKLASNVKALRAPVPLLVGKHDAYFDESTVADLATAPTTTQAISESQPAPAQAASSDAAAKASIEMDGYRNVKALVRAPDGSWHGRAMRGTVEIAVSVGPDGNVSQD
jgi:hypothetical protein